MKANVLKARLPHVQPRPAGANATRPHFHTMIVNGVRIRYVLAGEEHIGAAPPVLLLHGYNGSLEQFYPYTLPGLASRRTVLAPDLPGHGGSGRLPTRCGLESYIQVLGGFLETLGVDRADIIGHSMGGQVAIALAARRTELVRRLVLVASSGLPRHAPLWRVVLSGARDPSFYHLRLYPAYFRANLQARAVRTCWRIVFKETVEEQARQLCAPTLVVWGERDGMVPISQGRRLAEAIPGARLVIFRRAGHMPFYRWPRQFNRLVLDFLDGAPVPLGK